MNASDARSASPTPGLPGQPGREWLDVQDLAARFKTSPRHVFRLADSGRMPCGVKLGQLRRWARRDIEAWEAGGCKPVRTDRAVR